MSKSETLTTHAGVDMEEQESSLTDSGNEKLYSHLETVWWFLPKLNILLPYVPTAILVGIYPNELKT